MRFKQHSFSFYWLKIWCNLLNTNFIVLQNRTLIRDLSIQNWNVLYAARKARRGITAIIHLDAIPEVASPSIWKSPGAGPQHPSWHAWDAPTFCSTHWQSLSVEHVKGHSSPTPYFTQSNRHMTNSIPETLILLSFFLKPSCSFSFRFYNERKAEHSNIVVAIYNNPNIL